ncbi:MAG: TonB-dependent receptor [Desulfurivibrionaceae bacterium]|jgi:outer membrane receptor protein involved in Fe transport
MLPPPLLGLLILCVVFCAPVLQDAWGADEDFSGTGEETMLMFVGEALPVATVASRHPESPLAAPAMVTVVGREEIERRGWQTLADLLSVQPGFFMAAGGRGSVPYLRGIRDSVLFLYDGVPITTDVTKSLAPLDREMSLVGVDRVEIVRGPGSVLWGPDAFAGVVNIVPLRGRQRPGVETGLLVRTEQRQGATVTWGVPGPNGDIFLAASGDRERFYSSDYTAQLAEGSGLGETVAPSGATELVGTANYGDWLHLTGRWSDFTRRYTMGSADGSLRWPGEKEAPVNLLKATASKVVGPSHYTFTGFYQEVDYRILDADIERRQRNQVSHLELLWDRRLLERGLLTVGGSWRRNAVDGAVVRDGFLPDFLAPHEVLFVPRVDQADFTNHLASIFSQFRYQWGETEWWAGGRLDDHSQYRATRSYSLGLNRPITEAVRIKASYGNAFRSPYSSQLFDNLQFEPESIRTASAQLAWTPAEGHLLELTIFQSRIGQHRAEDPYGGLSLPSVQEVHGVELAAVAPLGPVLEVNAGLSLVGGGEDERFEALRYAIIRPDGSRVSVYDRWAEPVDQGPGWLVNGGLNWKIGVGHNLLWSGRIGGSTNFSYDKGAVEGSYTHPLLLDVVYRRPGFLAGQDSFIFRLTNLLDRDYLQPDIFGPVAGPPRAATLIWRLRW